MRLSLLITDPSYLGPVRECVFNDTSDTTTGESRGLVGRDPATCRMVIEEGSASRRHFEVLFSQGAFWIQNLSETNGTQIVGKKLLSRRNDRIEIEHDDRILVGDTELRASILFDESDAPPHAQAVTREPETFTPPELPASEPIPDPIQAEPASITADEPPPFPALDSLDPPPFTSIESAEPPPFPAIEADDHSTDTAADQPPSTHDELAASAVATIDQDDVSEPDSGTILPIHDAEQRAIADEPTDKRLASMASKADAPPTDPPSIFTHEAPAIIDLDADEVPQSDVIEPENDSHAPAQATSQLIPEDLDLEALLGMASPAPKSPAKASKPEREVAKRAKDPSSQAQSPAPAASTHGQTPPHTAHPDEVAAILKAAGLDSERAHALAHNVRAEHVGALLAALVDALASQLQTRNSFKHMFRLSSTEVRLAGNNPLKLAITGQEILARLFDPQRGFLGGVDAVRDATLDLQIHEAAIASGIRSSFDALLDRFDPARIEEATVKAGSALLGGFGGGRDAAAWKAYRQSYEQNFGDRHRAFTTIYLRGFGDDYDASTKKAKAESRKNSPHDKKGKSKP